MNRLKRELARGKSKGQLQKDQFAQLRGKIWAAKRKLKDLTNELDPNDLGKILKRIVSLTSRAETLSPGPGLAGITIIARDLSRTNALRTSDAVRGDVAERHRGAFAALTRTATSADLGLLVESVLEDSSQLGIHRFEREDGQEVEERSANADAWAIRWTRNRLAIHLSQIEELDEAKILAAIDIFRKRRWEKKGRAPKGFGYSTETERAETVRTLLKALGVTTAKTGGIAGKADGLERQLREKRKERGQRVRRLVAR